MRLINADELLGKCRVIINKDGTKSYVCDAAEIQKARTICDFNCKGREAIGYTFSNAGRGSE